MQFVKEIQKLLVIAREIKRNLKNASGDCNCMSTES